MIPAGLPADLLERRPDVAEAERQLASANARIGVAKASFFPVLTLTGSGGFVSGDIDSLFKWDSRTWSIGPSLSLPLFAGGRNRANYRRSQAVHQEAIAHYRQRVLVAFGDVENSLSGIHHLATQAEAQQRADELEAARERARAEIAEHATSEKEWKVEIESAPVADPRVQELVRVTRISDGEWKSEDLADVRFVPLIGEEGWDESPPDRARRGAKARDGGRRTVDYVRLNMTGRKAG